MATVKGIMREYTHFAHIYPVPEQPNSTNFLASLAAFVIVVGGMKIAVPLLVPLLLAVFISIIVAAPYLYLHQKGVPKWLALFVVLLVFCEVVLGLGGIISASAQQAVAQLPLYQARLQQHGASVVAWLHGWGIEMSAASLTEYLSPAKIAEFASTLFAAVRTLLGNGLLILVAVVFILLEAPNIPEKWRVAHGNSRHADYSLARLHDAMKNVNYYMAIKTATSLLTGISIALLLWLIGVDYPLLWGALAFLFNFIPNIGSFLAAVPAILLALLQLGLSAGLFTTLAFVAVNIGVGTVLEPRVMGKGLGLSTLVVFVSLILWGWVLGIVGMFLSVPLTLAMKIALDSNPKTRWMAVMLGPRVETRVRREN